MIWSIKSLRTKSRRRLHILAQPITQIGLPPNTLVGLRRKLIYLASWMRKMHLWTRHTWLSSFHVGCVYLSFLTNKHLSVQRFLRMLVLWPRVILLVLLFLYWPTFIVGYVKMHDATPYAGFSKACFPLDYVHAWLAFYFNTHHRVPIPVRGSLMIDYSGKGGAKYFDEFKACLYIHKAKYVAGMPLSNPKINISFWKMKNSHFGFLHSL